jgi:hypothetical protein
MKTRYYEKPVMEVTFFESSDVITLSVVQASTKKLDLETAPGAISLRGKWNS